MLSIVHQLQRRSRDLRERRGIARQATEHASTAFGCLKQKYAAPPVARRHRLGQDFTFFELEDHFEPARQRVLEGGHCSFGQRRSWQLKQQGVLVVLDDRDDTLRCWSVGLVVPFLFAAGPAPGRGIDPKTENALVLAAPQSLVEPADGRARRIGERQDRAVVIAGDAGRDIELAVAPGPSEHRLDIEALPLPILVVRRDPLGRQRLDIVDAQHIADGMDAAHGGAAHVTTLGLVQLDARRRIRRKYKTCRSQAERLLRLEYSGGSLAL